MTSSDKILIVDDDSEICELLSISLSCLGYEVTSANDGLQALERIGAERFNVVVLDLMLPGPDGIEVLRHIREQRTETEVIILTAYASLETAIKALRMGAYDYVTKPFRVDTIRSTIRRAVEKQRLETRLAAIYDLSREMALSLNVDRVAEVVLDIVERVLEFEICDLWLIDEEQDQLYRLAARGTEEEAGDRKQEAGGKRQEAGSKRQEAGGKRQEAGGKRRETGSRGQEAGSRKRGELYRLPLSGEKGIIAAVARSGDPLYVPDVREDPRYVAVRATTRSELAVPLKAQEHVIGVLSVESAELDTFSPADARLFSTLAAQAAVAIENARLHEQARQEITERKRAEKELKRRRDHYRAVINGLHDQVLIVDHDYRITDVNAVVLRQMGCTRKEVVGRHCYEVIQQRSEPCNSTDYPCPARQVWETGQPARCTHARYDHEGSLHWIDVAASPLRDAQGQITQVIQAHRDVTAERQLQERLAGVHALGRELVLSRDEQQVAQVAVDAAMFLLQSRLCGLWLVDREERTLIPQAYAGGTQSVNLYPLPLDDEDSIIAAVARSEDPTYIPNMQPDVQPNAQKEPHDIGASLENRSALCVPLKVKGKLVGVLNAESDRPDAFDETDLRSFSALADYSSLALENARLYEAERKQRRLVEQSQAQLVQSEKLAATGRLAASLAHEINNPLQAIHNSLQLVLTFPLEPDERREYLQMASEEVERLIGIGTRILSFARRPQRELRPTNLNVVVEKTLALANKYFQHRHVVLQWDLSPDLPAVMTIPGELEQVFLNLVINAVESMPEGGTLHISSRLAEDGHLAVVFSDTGHGIPPEHLDRLFEPFFSTKEEGTGLGLNVSYGVVKRHGGEITVQSVVGEGTTFTVWMPALPG